MGMSFSFLASYGRSGEGPAAAPGLGDLPESCVASVLVHLDPPQICRLARLNRAFRGASSADFVWESKLPSNYESVVKRVFEKDSKDVCKRDIYSRLCRTNSFDGGSKKVWLDKTTGRTCMSISSSGLAIMGIDDRRYWSRIPTEESRFAGQFQLLWRFSSKNLHKTRFSSVAYLQQTWWFEVACNAVFSLTDDEAARGVVTHSSGNHAAALALAAKLRGIPAHIVIPKNAPKCKVENVIRYGGRVIWSEPFVKSREEVAAKVIQETGGVLIHPYNDGHILS